MEKATEFFSAAFLYAIFRVCAYGYILPGAQKHIKKAVEKIVTKRDTLGFYPAVKGKMRQMALHITSPEFDGNISGACEKIGVSRSTYYRWQQDGNYREFVNYLIEEYTESEMSNVWRAVVDTAKKGDPRAQKLFMELKGRYKQSVDMTGAVTIISGEDNV